MVTTLNPKYKPPSRDHLTNNLVDAWFNVEKDNLVLELKDVQVAAITADGWTACTRDHYLTVTLHYVIKDHLHQKVLKTQACYESQTGLVVAEEMEAILKEFGLDRKRIAAVTVDNASNMDVAVKRMNVLKLGCFAHTLNLGGQKAIGLTSVSNWLAKIRSVIVWLRKTSMAKVVLKEKQPIL